MSHICLIYVEYMSNICSVNSPRNNRSLSPELITSVSHEYLSLLLNNHIIPSSSWGFKVPIFYLGSLAPPYEHACKTSVKVKVCMLVRHLLLLCVFQTILNLTQTLNPNLNPTLTPNPTLTLTLP